MHLDISQQPLYMEIYRKSAWKPRRRLCASLRSRSASQHFRRATLYGNFQVKCHRPNPRPTFCASPRSGKSTFRKSHFIWNFRGKMLRPRSGTHTLCEPAHSKCTSTFEKGNFIRKFIGKMVETRVSTLIKHRPLHLLQEPLSVGTLFGEPATWKMQRALANRNVIK